MGYLHPISAQSGLIWSGGVTTTDVQIVVENDLDGVLAVATSLSALVDNPVYTRRLIQKGTYKVSGAVTLIVPSLLLSPLVLFSYQPPLLFSYHLFSSRITSSLLL